MHEKFLNQIFIETMKGSLRIVSIPWDKKIWGQSWCPLIFFSLTFFQEENFLKHRRVPLRNASVLWYKIFRRRMVIPVPLLCMKYFDMRFSLNYRKVSLRSFRHCEEKKLPAEICNISLLCIFFEDRIFLKSRRSPLRIFSLPWDKTISMEDRDICSFLLSPKVFDTRK